MNTREHVVNLEIPEGESSEKIGFTPPVGLIQRAVIYYGEKHNTGFINASIENDNGGELSIMQHIDNYRSRNSSYLDAKPLYAEGGNRMHFLIKSDQPFTGNFKAQLILIYLDNGTATNCPS